MTSGGVAAGGAARLAPWREQVQAGLVSLGWQAREADQAITIIEPDLADGGGEVDVAAALRAALRVLGRS